MSPEAMFAEAAAELETMTIDEFEVVCIKAGLKPIRKSTFYSPESTIEPKRDAVQTKPT
jgi:hypothetical protein